MDTNQRRMEISQQTENFVAGKRSDTDVKRHSNVENITRDPASDGTPATSPASSYREVLICR